METPLRILYLEDDPKDAELVQEMLETEFTIGHVKRVENESDFQFFAGHLFGKLNRLNLEVFGDGTQFEELRG